LHRAVASKDHHSSLPFPYQPNEVLSSRTHLSKILQNYGKLVELLSSKTGVLEAGRAARKGIRATRTVANKNVGKVHAVGRDVVELDH
jgi:hypothetical protein